MKAVVGAQAATRQARTVMASRRRMVGHLRRDGAAFRRIADTGCSIAPAPQPSQRAQAGPPAASAVLDCNLAQTFTTAGLRSAWTRSRGDLMSEGVAIVQGKLGTRLTFQFGEQLTYTLRDHSGEREFAVPYQAINVLAPSMLVADDVQFFRTLLVVPIVAIV